METDKKNHMILQYKSKLFDLMENKDPVILGSWMSIIADFFNASEAVFYKKDVEYPDKLRLIYSASGSGNFPETLPLTLMGGVFNGGTCAGAKSLEHCNGLARFNTAFHFTFKDQDKGYLFLQVPPDFFWNAGSSFHEEFSLISAKFLSKIEQLAVVIEEEKKYKELFRVTEKFHSSMSIDVVLTEIINTLKRMFPSCQYFLMLSNDYHYDTDLPIKPLQYDSADEAAMEAYVTGEISVIAVRELQHSTLYAPLCGKQGVYGVLQIVSDVSFVFQNNEIDFIRLLANTAGGALENAKLYQQSTRLIEDLQLINETSRQLNASSRLEDTLQFLKGQISHAFQVHDIAFVMLNANSYSILDGSSQIFKNSEGEIYLHYVYKSLKKDKEAIFISDFNSRAGEARPGYLSIMAVPMIDRDEVKGFCVAMHKNAYYFTFDMFKLFRSLIHHSTLAIANSILREELERLVITDHLTQLFAKNYLNTQMEESMNRDDEGTFLLLDIDNFKAVNDTHGHQVGDQVLIQVADIIKQNIRASDIGARWGGEELAIYLPGVSLAIGEEIAQRLVQAVCEKTSPKITISCGVSYWNKTWKDGIQSLFDRADIGLYNAKNSGKNQVVVTKESRQSL